MLTKAQFELRDRARGLAEARIAPRAAAVDRDEAYPWDNVKALTKAGFMGMTLPQAYGGARPGPMQPLIVVGREVGRYAVGPIRSAPVLVGASPHVEGWRGEVFGRSAAAAANNHRSPAFRRPTFQPIDRVSRNLR